MWSTAVRLVAVGWKQARRWCGSPYIATEPCQQRDGVVVHQPPVQPNNNVSRALPTHTLSPTLLLPAGYYSRTHTTRNEHAHTRRPTSAIPHTTHNTQHTRTRAASSLQQHHIAHSNTQQTAADKWETRRRQQQPCQLHTAIQAAAANWLTQTAQDNGAISSQHTPQ